MADNSVFITGAANGAFTEAMADLPPWATENTALQIEKHLRKNLNIQTQALRDLVRAAKGRSGTGAGGMDADKSRKLNSELDKLLKGFKDANTEEAKKKKRDKEREAADRKSFLGIKEFTNKWQKAEFVLTSLAIIGSKVLNAEQQYIKTYDDLYKSGINVLNGQAAGVTGMETLNQVVRLTGLRLETLQEVAQKYSNTINAVGFTKFAKATGLATANMKDLGYSSKETAELIAAYTDMQSNYTDMRRKSEAEISQGAQEFAKQIQKTSLTMGISQEQLKANAKSLGESSDSTVISARYGAKAAQNVNTILGGLKPELAGKIMGSVMLAGQNLEMASDNVARDFTTSGSAFSQQLVQMVKALPNENLDQLNKRISNIVKDPRLDAEIQRLALLASQGNSSAKVTLDTLTQLRASSNRVSEANENQVKGAVATKAANAGLQTEQEKMAATMQAMFFPLETQIEALTESMKLLNNATYGLANNTNSTVRSYAGATLIILGQLAGIVAAIGAVRSVLGLFGKSAGTIAEGAASAGKAMSMLGTLARGASVVGAGVAGYAVGDAVVKPLIDSMVQSISGDKSLTLGSAIYDMFNDDPMADSGKNTKISVPKTPAPSTIASPSAVPANPASAPAETTATSTPANSPVGPGIEKAPAGIDINSTLTYQSNLLAQILEGTKSLVSVNKDILRYTRNQ